VILLGSSDLPNSSAGMLTGTNQVIPGLENNASCWHRFYCSGVFL